MLHFVPRHLDAGAGCLIVYEDQSADTVYDEALTTIDNMGKVVDALYHKAGGLAQVPTSAVAKAEGKEGKEGKDGKDSKGGAAKK